MTQRKSYRLSDIVKRFGGELIGDPGIRIRQVATLESARPSDITFLTHSRYLSQLNQTRAGAVILGADVRDASSLPRIICANPYAYYAKVSALLNPLAAEKPGIHKSAVVAKSARVAKSASIGACAVIGKDAQIADSVIIGPGSFIGEGVKIAAQTRIQANVTVYHSCRIGARCIVHSGVVIGADGFGIARENNVWKKIPHIGTVRIGDDVEIGANTTIDRGANRDTVVGEGTKIDNQVQIAHNVEIGRHCIIVAQVGISGSVKLGDFVAIGGQSGVNGHVRIGDGAQIAAVSTVHDDVPPGARWGGTPARPVKEWFREMVALRRLAQRDRDEG